MVKSFTFVLTGCLLCCFIPLSSQSVSDKDAFFLKSIHDHILKDGHCYDWLYHLSENIGARLSGSDNYNKAADYVHHKLNELGVDSVWRQECEVNYWERGSISSVVITDHLGVKHTLRNVALGGSIGTPPNGISGEVIEVRSLDEVERLGEKEIAGKIVFYNRPMDPVHINTFMSYGGAVDQRAFGSVRAAQFGGIAALVRSMTTRQDDVPHTGTMVYRDDVVKIPGLAISTNDANLLSGVLKSGLVTAEIITDCRPAGKRMSDNVIAEIKGSEFPDEIILVGGHLDSWDLGGGAHDDGAGCVHSMQVLHTLLALGYKPKRTIRCVLFANEENGLAGGNEYARISNENNEFHLAAIESDAGGFTPKSFSLDGHPDVLESYIRQVSDWLPLLEPYGLAITKGGSGADINPLKSQKGLLMGLRPDSQRYFDYHHTAIDRIDVVNERELKLGAAAMTAIVYLIDQYGLTQPK